MSKRILIVDDQNIEIIFKSNDTKYCRPSQKVAPHSGSALVAHYPIFESGDANNQETKRI